MINRNIISIAIPQLQLHDTVQRALQFMSDFHVTHLPVVQDEKFLGMVSEDELLDAHDESQNLYRMQSRLLLQSVPAGMHIFETLNRVVEHQLSAVPVVEGEGHFVGVITQADILKHIAMLTGAGEKGAVIILAMDKQDFAFSELTRLIETNDAFITQLNTSFLPDTGEFIVIIRINKTEISDIIATLQRFEYRIRYYFGEEMYENELKTNFDHLMNYLNI